jgi:DNA-directed RNA polymerase specialized sigma24 family protein
LGEAVSLPAGGLGDLVTRIGTGDREALARFLTDYGPLIRRRVRGKLRASMRRLFDSQDILSTLSRRLDSYVRDGKFAARSEDEFWAMVFKVAHNSVVEKARIVESLRVKEGEDSAFAALMLGKIETAPEAVSAAGIELEDVLAMLKSEEDRTITRLWMTGSNLAQIASHLGFGEPAVRQRWHRIRETIRTSLTGSKE